ncbi:excitatory amino acid transporter 2 isoform X1 [Rhodnius prolixus]|uniref:excitatory amino acid transporter 2 isoform X1 n=2 Tax=Rhodnius prolixus TaxID=13249 RepID=UPI003D18B51A
MDIHQQQMKISRKDYLFTRMAPDGQDNRSTCRRWMSDNLFLFCTLFGVIAGIVLGFVVRPLNPSQDVIVLISYPGELFMRVLKLMILPFVISCLIMGTATLNISKNGKIAIRTMTYFIITSVLNVILGIILVMSIHPGSPHVKYNSTVQSQDVKTIRPLDGFLDMGRNLVPDNLFQAAFEQTFTEYVPVSIKYEPYETGNSNNKTSANIGVIQKATKRQLQFRDGTNTLGIIFFCLIFGSVLGTLGPHKIVVINFFNVIYEVLLKMLMGAIWFTPVGVGSVICGKIISLGQLAHTLTQLSWFIITVAIGIIIYQFIILQIIYYIFVRKNPLKYYMSFGPSIVTAFATASKSAAMPITFRVMDDKVKVDKRITRFILPIGTINMDGTALFLTVSVIFIAQMNNIYLGMGEIMTIGLSCTAASMSSATVPSAALVLVLMLCSTINAPAEDVSLLFAVDWFVDRLRTTNNLLGDCYACAVVESLSKKELAVPLEEETPPHANGNASIVSNGTCIIEITKNENTSI